MSTDWNSTDIVCPYYHGTDVRGGRAYIVCDGLDEYCTMQMRFETLDRRRAHIEAYCAEKYWSCPVCDSLDFFHLKQEEGEL